MSARVKGEYEGKGFWRGPRVRASRRRAKGDGGSRQMARGDMGRGAMDGRECPDDEAKGEVRFR